jgi:hypothetical protein
MVNSERFQQNFTFVSQCDIKYMMTLPIKTSQYIVLLSLTKHRVNTNIISIIKVDTIILNLMGNLKNNIFIFLTN